MAAVFLCGLWAQSARAKGTCPERPILRREALKLADALFRKGVAHFKAKRYREALRLFQCTHQTVSVPLTQYWIGRSAEASGLAGLALVAYQGILASPPSMIQAAELHRRISRLKGKLWHGASRARAASPSGGPNRAPPGASLSRKELRAAARRHRLLRVTAWSSGALGGVMLISSLALAVVAGQDYQKVQNPGEDAWWDNDIERRYHRINGLNTAAGVCFGVGLALAATSTVLFLLTPKKERARPKARPAITSGGTGLRVSF